MGIDAGHLRYYVIEPALHQLARYAPTMHSLAAVRLLLGTAAQESHMGTYLHQIQGPALGIYQCEPATAKSLWEDYIQYRPSLAALLTSPDTCPNVGNLTYWTLLCRIHYWRVPASLPTPNDLKGLARYWKAHYNTYQGKGTVEEFMENYNRFVADL